MNLEFFYIVWQIIVCIVIFWTSFGAMMGLRNMKIFEKLNYTSLMTMTFTFLFIYF